jgi:putative flippase GtrA
MKIYEVTSYRFEGQKYYTHIAKAMANTVGQTVEFVSDEILTFTDGNTKTYIKTITTED